MEKKHISSNLFSKSIKKLGVINNKAVKLIEKEFWVFSTHSDSKINSELIEEDKYENDYSNNEDFAECDQSQQSSKRREDKAHSKLNKDADI